MRSSWINLIGPKQKIQAVLKDLVNLNSLLISSYMRKLVLRHMVVLCLESLHMTMSVDIESNFFTGRIPTYGLDCANWKYCLCTRLLISI